MEKVLDWLSVRLDADFVMVQSLRVPSLISVKHISNNLTNWVEKIQALQLESLLNNHHARTDWRVHGWHWDMNVQIYIFLIGIFCWKQVLRIIFLAVLWSTFWFNSYFTLPSSHEAGEACTMLLVQHPFFKIWGRRFFPPKLGLFWTLQPIAFFLLVELCLRFAT